MKRLIPGIFLIFVSANMYPQQTIAIPDLKQPHQIAVDGNDLYIFDEADYSLSNYTLTPWALKWKTGQKGDGAREFKYLPFVFIQPDGLSCTDFTKILWLSKTGQFLKAVDFTNIKDFDIDSEMLLIPVKDGFVRITADHGLMKRRVSLLDSAFKTIKNLYEGPFVWQQGSATDVRTDTLVAGGRIYIADTAKFLITVFDDKGNLVQTIDKSGEVEDNRARARMHQFCVSKDRIYATTYAKKDGRTEMLILDLEGRILKRLSLPLSSIRPDRGVLRYDLFTVGGGKLYELVQTAGTGKWDLVITDLSR